MKSHDIAIIPGDGVGKKIAGEATKMLEGCYTTMGWDQEAVPKQELLQRLGLSEPSLQYNCKFHPV